MFVNIGNARAIEAFRDPASDDPELLRYMPVEGERVTEIVFADGMGMGEALSTVAAIMVHHMMPDATPSWIESDSAGLTSLLAEHWGLTEDQTTRPEGWGNNLLRSGSDQD